MLPMTSRSLLRSALDSAEDARIGPAPADVAIHVANNVITARIFVAREQRRSLHDLAGLAVAALRHLQINPGFLQRMIAVGRKAFDRGDILARHHRNRSLAGTHGTAIEVNRA